MPSDPLHDGWLPDIDDPELDLDDLIEQITVDAYGDEGYWSFRQAFEDHIQFPVTASVIGVEVTVSEIDFDGDERRGLTSSAERDDRTWTVPLMALAEIPQVCSSKFPTCEAWLA